jgi:hypothetical protein
MRHVKARRWMSRDGRMVATLRIRGHHLPDARLKDALRDAAVFGAPAQFNVVFAEVRAVKADDAQAALDRFRGGRSCHRVTSSFAAEPPTGRGLVTVLGRRPSGRLDECEGTRVPSLKIASLSGITPFGWSSASSYLSRWSGRKVAPCVFAASVAVASTGPAPQPLLMRSPSGDIRYSPSKRGGVARPPLLAGAETKKKGRM